MTAAHEAVRRYARLFAPREVHLSLNGMTQFTSYCTMPTVSRRELSNAAGVPDDQIPQIITDLRARGEWPEGLRVVGEEQR